jgi:hypothetical protein
MVEFKVGDKVRIIQIDGNYGNPYVGQMGIIQEIHIQKPENNYQVVVLTDENPDLVVQATLTLFDKELEKVDE